MPRFFWSIKDKNEQTPKWETPPPKISRLRLPKNGVNQWASLPKLHLIDEALSIYSNIKKMVNFLYLKILLSKDNKESTGTCKKKKKNSQVQMEKMRERKRKAASKGYQTPISRCSYFTDVCHTYIQWLRKNLRIFTLNFKSTELKNDEKYTKECQHVIKYHRWGWSITRRRSVHSTWHTTV